MSLIDQNLATRFTNQFWGSSVLPALAEFIRIPCKSPAYDENWEDNGNLEAAASFLDTWAHSQNIAGLESGILKFKGRSPFLYVDIPGQGSQETTLFYGHLDKMPEAEGWAKGLGPWKSVIKGNRIYGRGVVDDGYAFFTIIAAIKLLQKQGVPHGRCVIIFEATEESGSYDLPAYLSFLKARIGSPTLITCLDAGCNDYLRLWCTNSLRGIIEGTLKVEILNEPVHSGVISGIVPSSFRILRILLDRIENSRTGEILLKSCQVKIPKSNIKDATAIARFLGKDIYTKFPLVGKMQPVATDLTTLLLNNTWKPALSYIGAEGLPKTKDAGTVLRPMTAIQLSLRIPPHCLAEKVINELKQKLEKNPPYGAKVTFEPSAPMVGWSAPEMSPWLKNIIKNASLKYFGHSPLYSGEGGSIGIIPLLQQEFPTAQFFLSGVAGPNSGEHGPNENLYIPAAKKITCCMAELLAKR